VSHKEKITELFDVMAVEVCSFIKESESEFTEGWLFATLARYLEDHQKVEFKKVSSRSFYKSKNR
jgi:hypothetical protein